MARIQFALFAQGPNGPISDSMQVAEDAETVAAAFAESHGGVWPSRSVAVAALAADAQAAVKLAKLRIARPRGR